VSVNGDIVSYWNLARREGDRGYSSQRVLMHPALSGSTSARTRFTHSPGKGRWIVTVGGIRARG